MYSYRASVKSDVSDELINVYVLRPAAGFIVRLLYHTPVTPNQVTAVSIISGVAAAFFYFQGTSTALFFAGILVTLKDLLDTADGQLARAKHLYSRFGRFFDSIGDFAVNLVLLSSMGWTLYTKNNEWEWFVFAAAGFLGISIRVSYHVFYQVKFLHLQNMYALNRISEEIQEEDALRGGRELIAQRIFQVLYGWQDRLISRIDAWSRKNISLPKSGHSPEDKGITKDPSSQMYRRWYSDRTGLRLSGFFGLGSELFLLTGCSLLNHLGLYLMLNIFMMNTVFISTILYRRFLLSHIMVKQRAADCEDNGLS